MRKFRITVEGVAYEVWVEELEAAAPADAAVAASPSPAPVRAPVAAPAAPPAALTLPAAALAAAGPGDVVSPLAGTVVSIAVAAGQSVSAGEAVVVLEAMKMNTQIVAPRAGTVNAVHVSVGATVAEGQRLVSIS